MPYKRLASWVEPPYANDTLDTIEASANFLRGMLDAGANINMCE